MKVVINACYGGFGLSPEATLKLWELGCKGLEATHVDAYWPKAERAEYEKKYPTMGHTSNLKKWRDYLAMTPAKRKEDRHLFLNVFTPDEQYVLNARDIERHDPILIRVVEEMGEAAYGSCADLRVVEIPDGVKYVIEEYDGNEHIAEEHRTWR
jgi:hypothetical protein